MQQKGLDCSEPTPRVNADIMQRYVGRKVRLVCKVDEFGEGGMLKATASDGKPVHIRPKQGSNYDTAFVEVEGVVENATTVQEQSFTTFGDSFGEWGARTNERHARLPFDRPPERVRPANPRADANPPNTPCAKKTPTNPIIRRHENLQRALRYVERADAGLVPLKCALALACLGGSAGVPHRRPAFHQAWTWPLVERIPY